MKKLRNTALPEKTCKVLTAISLAQICWEIANQIATHCQKGNLYCPTFGHFSQVCSDDFGATKIWGIEKFFWPYFKFHIF